MKATKTRPTTPGSYWFRPGNGCEWRVMQIHEQHGVLVSFPSGNCKTIDEIVSPFPEHEWGEEPLTEPEN